MYREREDWRSISSSITKNCPAPDITYTMRKRGHTHSDTHKANTGKAVLCMESETRHAPNSKLERRVAKIMECVRSVKC